MVAGKPQHLATADLDVVAVPPDWRTELLVLVTNPNVAFILLLIGVYGLIFEFLNPGAVAPGLIGAISLLVALYALAFVPINYVGAALVLLGVALMVAEVNRRLRRAWGRRHRRLRHRIADDVPHHVRRVLAFARGIVAGAAIGSAALLLLVLAAAVALAPAASGDRQRGADRRRWRDLSWQDGEGE